MRDRQTDATDAVTETESSLTVSEQA